MWHLRDVDKYVDGGPVGAPLTLLAPRLNMGGAHTICDAAPV